MIGERLDVLPIVLPHRPAVNNLSITDCEPLVRRLVLAPYSAIRLGIDPFNVCKHRKPRLGARAAWGQKNGAANRPAYCVKEKQTSLIDR